MEGISNYRVITENSQWRLRKYGVGISNYRSIGKMEKNIPCRARPRGDSAGEGANGDTAGGRVFSKSLFIE